MTDHSVDTSAFILGYQGAFHPRNVFPQAACMHIVFSMTRQNEPSLHAPRGIYDAQVGWGCDLASSHHPLEATKVRILNF